VVSWAYIAGFFDGEGHVGLTLGANRRNITISQTGDRGYTLLHKVQGFLQHHGITSSVHGYNYVSHPRKQKLWTLHITDYKSSCSFTRELLPFLSIKKTEAQDFRRFISMYPPLVSSAFRSETARRAWETKRG